MECIAQWQKTVMFALLALASVSCPRERMWAGEVTVVPVKASVTVSEKINGFRIGPEFIVTNGTSAAITFDEDGSNAIFAIGGDTKYDALKLFGNPLTTCKAKKTLDPGKTCYILTDIQVKDNDPEDDINPDDDVGNWEVRGQVFYNSGEFATGSEFVDVTDSPVPEPASMSAVVLFGLTCFSLRRLARS